MDCIEEKIIHIIDEHAEELQALAEDLFLHGEQGYHEYRTAGIVADYLKKLGLTTREGLAITGIKAEIGKPKGTGPNIALIGELDALACPTHPAATEKGFAHACGHYAQIICMLGAALALSDEEVAASLDGTATIFAVPAEEYQDASVRAEVLASHDVHCAGGKCELLRRGEFDDIDMSITTHSLMVSRDSNVDLMLGNSACTGFIGKTILMHGKAAHAAAAPDEGINALNAASLGMAALGMIRETFREQDYVRVHPYIRKGGEAINIVPSEVIVDMMVRANKQSVVESTSDKVDNCYRGAAMCIGCKADIINSQGYMPCPQRLPDQVMWDAAALLGDNYHVASIPDGACNTASTDVGDLFAVMPVLNFTFGGSTGALHSKDFKVSNPDVAHIMPAKMMALLAYRLLKSGATEANTIINNYKAPYTFDAYRAFCKKWES